MRRGSHQHSRAAQNRPTRPPHIIDWINDEGQVAGAINSSTRTSRALRHVERLRNTRRDESLTPHLRKRT